MNGSYLGVNFERSFASKLGIHSELSRLVHAQTTTLKTWTIGLHLKTQQWDSITHTHPHKRVVNEK